MKKNYFAASATHGLRERYLAIKNWQCRIKVSVETVKLSVIDTILMKNAKFAVYQVLIKNRSSKRGYLQSCLRYEMRYSPQNYVTINMHIYVRCTLTQCGVRQTKPFMGYI
jgi:hypothetical protein